ncbi:MAG: TOBE domain-containing protein, partial [Candidatus Fermentibacteria bacterium]|nr:TOBE domain-containing protein [Candidatus Fermentibacteria bacterium]
HSSFLQMKNVFPVEMARGTATTSDGLEISLADREESGSGHIAISPESIVVSTGSGRGRTSERNHFPGTITEIVREGYGFAVEVQCRTTHFSAAITPVSLRNLNLKHGSHVWLSWKASAIHTF